MKSRMLAAILFAVLMVLYYTLYVLLLQRFTGEALAIYERFLIVCIAMVIPSLLSGFFLGNWIVHAKRHFLYKTWIGLLASFVICWLYYFIAYCIYAVYNTDSLAATPTGTQAVIHPFGNFSDFSHYIVMVGGQFSAAIAILQALFVGMIGTWILIAASSRFRRVY